MGVNGAAVKRTQSVQIQPSPNIEHYTFQVLMNLQGRIAQDLKSFRAQPSGASLIMLQLVWLIVNIAINLDHDLA